MGEDAVARWFDAYLADFVGMGRGDIDDMRRILDHYDVPLLISTDAGSILLADEDQVLAAARRQADGMRSERYDRSDVLTSETTVLNKSCAMHRARFARRRADDSEIGQLEATYLITEGADGRRISAIIVHSAA